MNEYTSLNDESLDEINNYSRKRNYAIWKRRSYKRDKKNSNLIIPYNSDLQIYTLTDNIEMPSDRRDYIKNKIHEFNNFKKTIPILQNMIRFILIILYTILFITYLYNIVLITFFCIFNPLVIFILLWTSRILLKAFIFIDTIFREKIRKSQLSKIIQFENKSIMNKGLFWDHGRDGYWLELIKL
jgi:hypothetical protein